MCNINSAVCLAMLSSSVALQVAAKVTPRNSAFTSTFLPTHLAFASKENLFHYQVSIGRIVRHQNKVTNGKNLTFLNLFSIRQMPCFAYSISILNTTTVPKYDIPFGS